MAQDCPRLRRGRPGGGGSGLPGRGPRPALRGVAIPAPAQPARDQPGAAHRPGPVPLPRLRRPGDVARIAEGIGVPEAVVREVLAYTQYRLSNHNYCIYKEMLQGTYAAVFGRFLGNLDILTLTTRGLTRLRRGSICS